MKKEEQCVDNLLRRYSTSPAASSVVALCAILRSNPALSLIDEESNPLELLGEVWDDKDADTTRWCWLRAGDTVSLVKFVPLGGHVVVVAVQKRSGSNRVDWSDTEPVTVSIKQLHRTSKEVLQQMRDHCTSLVEPLKANLVDRMLAPKPGPSNIFFPKCSAPPPSTPNHTVIPRGYGDADLVPDGGEPFGRSGLASGGMIFGPHHPMFHGDPAQPFARYDPLYPGGSRFGRGRSLLPGEPDPDHLPPFHPTAESNPAEFLSRGGRGGTSRGRGGFNYMW